MRCGLLRALPAGVIVALLCGAGCQTPDYDKADLQLDIDAAVPEEAETARICATSVGSREEGAGNGRLSLPGLAAGAPVEISVEVLTGDGARIGRSEPVTLSVETPYQVAAFAMETGEPCEPLGGPGSGDSGEGGFVEAGADSWLLVVRFLGSGW